MKKFLQLFCIFIFPILILGIGIECLIRNIPNGYALKNEVIAKNENTIETLVLGSSHSFYGVDPKYFDLKTFNYSEVSQTLDIDYEILKEYIDKLLKLKNVIIRLSYTTLYEKLDETSESWRLKDYSIYTDLNLNYNLKNHSEVLSVKLKTNLQKIVNYYLFQESYLNSTELGWGTDAKSIDAKNLEETGEIKAKKHSIEDKYYLDEAKETLTSLIELCKERDINVFLVTLPAYKSYTQNLDEYQLKTMIGTGKSLSKEYLNCYYFNFLESNDFVAEDFFDADHLNEKGAKKFSLLMNDILNKENNE